MYSTGSLICLCCYHCFHNCGCDCYCYCYCDYNCRGCELASYYKVLRLWLRNLRQEQLEHHTVFIIQYLLLHTHTHTHTAHTGTVLSHLWLVTGPCWMASFIFLFYLPLFCKMFILVRRSRELRSPFLPHHASVLKYLTIVAGDIMEQAPISLLIMKS